MGMLTHSFADSKRLWNHRSRWTHLPVGPWCCLIVNPNVASGVEAVMHRSVYDEYYYRPNEDIVDFLELKKKRIIFSYWKQTNCNKHMKQSTLGIHLSSLADLTTFDFRLSMYISIWSNWLFELCTMGSCFRREAAIWMRWKHTPPPVS